MITAKDVAPVKNRALAGGGILYPMFAEPLPGFYKRLAQ
jgi:hypothetical protein